MLGASAASDAAGQRADVLDGDPALDLRLLLAAGASARVRFTTAADGDLAVGRPAAELAELRQALVPLPWTWLRQVHGAEVVTVGQPGEHAGAEADAAATACAGAALAIQTADCAPVALVADHGMVAAVHAGWRGLVGGVIERAADALRGAANGSAGRLRAVIGPCIGPCCYEFGADDLDLVAARFGDEVRATTRAGRPALDVPAAVAVALRRAGAEVAAASTTCTACGRPAMFSHRARGDTARQAMVVWLEDGGAGGAPPCPDTGGAPGSPGSS